MDSVLEHDFESSKGKRRFHESLNPKKARKLSTKEGRAFEDMTFLAFGL